MSADRTIRIRLGQQIRQARLALGWTQERLGFASDIHRTYIGHIERGEKAITVETLHVLASALQCKASDLLRDAGL